MSYSIRPYESDSDKAFIMATFLLGLYYGDSWFSEIPKDVFMLNYKKVAEALVSSPNTAIVVACKQDEPDVIFGYSITSIDGSIIHWVYVKEKFRHMGVCRQLLPDNPTAVTHLTGLGLILLKQKLSSTCIFNPFDLKL